MDDSVDYFVDWLSSVRSVVAMLVVFTRPFERGQAASV